MQISIVIQHWLLDNGYCWEDGEQGPTDLAFPYIYVDDMKMLWDSDPSTFNQSEIVEVIPQFAEKLRLVRLIEVSVS